MIFRIALAVIGILAAVTAARADSTINNLSAGTTLTGTEQIPMYQGSNPAVTTTPNALKTYIGGAPSPAYPLAAARPRAAVRLLLAGRLRL